MTNYPWPAGRCRPLAAKFCLGVTTVALAVGLAQAGTAAAAPVAQAHASSMEHMAQTSGTCVLDPHHGPTVCKEVWA